MSPACEGPERRPRRLLALFAVVLLAVAALGVGACAGEYEEEPEEVGGDPAAAAVDDTTQPAEPAAGGEYFEPEPTTAAEGTAAVEVRLHGRTIEMPGSLPAGETTFLVSNTGDVEHSFEIEGNGIEEELEPSLQPGENGELTVTLEPGTYTVYCPVGNHRDEGMVTTLEVVG